MCRRYDVRDRALCLSVVIVILFAPLPADDGEVSTDSDRDLSTSAERIYQQKLALLKAKRSLSAHDVESMAMWSARIMFWESAKLRRELLLQKQVGAIGGMVSDGLVEAVDDGLAALKRRHDRMKALEVLLNTSVQTDETALARAMASFFRKESERWLAEQKQLRAGEIVKDLLPKLEVPRISVPANSIKIDMRRDGKLRIDGQERSLEQVEQYIADQLRKDPTTGVAIHASAGLKSRTVDNVVDAISKDGVRVMISVREETED